MREIYSAGTTPQQKIVAVNQKFGNTGIQSQQGTSRIIYDHIKVDAAGQNRFRFFEDSSARTFPFTNTGSDGNKLGVDDTMVIQSVLFAVWTLDPASGRWQLVNAISGNVANSLDLFSIEIANNKVVKKLTIDKSNAYFSKDTDNNNGVIDLQTQIVIPPLLNYVVELETAANIVPPALTDYYVECQIIGTGGIIAPRTTF
jgi:hypothetical protein